MMNLLKRILRMAARMAMVPVEVLVNGVRMLMMRPSPLADQAMDILDEAPDVSPEERQRRDISAKAEAPRIAKAAALIMRGEAVPRTVLDPASPMEGRYLEWLRSLGHGQLAVLVAMPAKAIDGHMNGGARLAGLPFVDEFDRPVEIDVEPRTPQEKLLAVMRAEAKARINRRAA